MGYPNLVTKSQRCAKSCDLYEKQITFFSLKTKYCLVIRMSSQNSPYSQDNLERVIDMQHCNPLIHQQFTESKIQVVMAECSHLRAMRQIQHVELFQAVVQQNVRELQALFGRRAEKYGPRTIREAQIAVSEVLGRLHFNTAAFCG